LFAAACAELTRSEKVERGQVLAALVQQPGDDFLRRGALEPRAPGDHLVQDAAKGEDVGARVDAIAGHLFRRHVPERAEHDVRRRAGDRRSIGAQVGQRVPMERQAEIQNLHRTSSGQEDVLGFQITVDDSAEVRRGQPVGDLRSNPDSFLPSERAGLDALAQRLALEQLHHSDGHVVHDGQLVDGNDAGVGERRDRAGFGFEPPAHLRVGRDVRGHDFDGHLACQAGIPGAVDLAHAAGADRLDDFVLGDAGAFGEDHNDCGSRSVDCRLVFRRSRAFGMQLCPR